MTYLQFTDFRNNSKKYFERIENGEIFIITRKGIPVARITPFEQNRTGWKHQVERNQPPTSLQKNEVKNETLLRYKCPDKKLH